MFQNKNNAAKNDLFSYIQTLNICHEKLMLDRFKRDLYPLVSEMRIYEIHCDWIHLA